MKSDVHSLIHTDTRRAAGKSHSTSSSQNEKGFCVKMRAIRCYDSIYRVLRSASPLLSPPASVAARQRWLLDTAADSQHWYMAIFAQFLVPRPAPLSLAPVYQLASRIAAPSQLWHRPCSLMQSQNPAIDDHVIDQRGDGHKQAVKACFMGMGIDRE
jgi:hypothetical protein